MKIGVLAIQGSVIEHVNALQSASKKLNLKLEIIYVRHKLDLDNISGIILPGGESTTQSKLLKRFGLFNVLKQKIIDGLPVYGTCAGAILLSKNVLGKNIPDTLQVMDITADRNAYGSQLSSFITEIEIKLNNKTSIIPAVFIRAPKLLVNTDIVKVLSEFKNNTILLQQNNCLVSSFHPELTNSTLIHEYFLKMCRG